MAVDEEISNFTKNFRELFLRGIPRLLNEDGAYLSFGCTFSGMEALAGYWSPGNMKNGEKFKSWLVAYMPQPYRPLVGELWDLRNSLIHGFSPKHFKLCHFQPGAHMTDAPPYLKVLNAESLFNDFKNAAERYLEALAINQELRQAFEARLADARGGGLYVG